MATKLFPTSQTRNRTNTFTTADTRIMKFTQQASVVSQADATVATLVAAANPQGTGTVAPLKRAAGVTLAAAGTVEADATIGAALFWVSPPVNAVTVSGTITANLRASESAAAANYAVGCKVYRVRAGTVDAAFAQGSSIVELGTSEAASSIALTPTSTALANGDSLALLIFFVGIGTSASGRTATVFWNGATGATGDTFLSFTETITEYPPITGSDDEQLKGQIHDWNATVARASIM